MPQSAAWVVIVEPSVEAFLPTRMTVQFSEARTTSFSGIGRGGRPVHGQSETENGRSQDDRLSPPKEMGHDVLS